MRLLALLVAAAAAVREFTVIIADAESMRSLFEQALAALRHEAAPPAVPTPLRRPAGGFGRKVG